jgi:ArsR family metal-binding transcriptional regulator
MLIEEYDIEVTSPPCDPGAERWSAFAHISVDVSGMLPYLNARLKGAVYDHAAQVLTWRSGGRTICLRPHEIAVSNLEDRSDAETVVKRMVDLVNRTWQQRDEIQPSLVKRERLKALEVYKLLPGKNCKECGYATCFTFALKVTADEARLESCPPLWADEYRSNRERLLAMLEAAGITVD